MLGCVHNDWTIDYPESILPSLSVREVATLVVRLSQPTIQKFYSITPWCNRFFVQNIGGSTRHTVPRREGLPRTKFSWGDFYQIESCSPRRRALTRLHGRRTFFAHTTADAEPTDARRDSVYPQAFVARPFYQTLYLHNLIRSGKVGPEKQDRTVCHTAGCGVRRRGWWGAFSQTDGSQFNLIRSSVEPLAGKWRTQPNCFLSLFPQV